LEINATYSHEMNRILHRISPKLSKLYRLFYADNFSERLIQVILEIEREEFENMLDDMRKIISDYHAYNTKN